MSKGGRLSRFLPRLFRSENKKAGSSPSDVRGPSCLIVFLDDSEENIVYKGSWKGQALFNVVCDKLNLSEKDYFGLRFVDDAGQAHWVELTKALSSQLKGCTQPHKFYFGVKFYAADPCKLREEITRYLFFLQIKRDILQGRLPLSFEDAAELCAYAVQSELGDFDPRSHTIGYVSEFCFLPNQTQELEARIAAMHRRCIGATPVMAEHRFLERVKWLEMYGVDLHPVQGESNVEYFLGLTPTGIVVYKQKTKVASYFWPRVTKASHKGKIFTSKVKDKNNEEHVYAFELSTKAACKHLWKCCIEHHTFFSGRSERLAASENRSREQPNVYRAASRRQARRVNSDSRLNGEQQYPDQYVPHNRGMVTMMGQPEPVRAPRHTSLPELHGRQSPRSIKSAPWESKFDHGLYTSGHDSPTSERKDGRHGSFMSGGSDSESGISQRKRYFPSRKGSDNESDASTSRRRRREMDSDSGSEVSFTNHGQSRKKRYTHASKDPKMTNSHILYPFHDKENNPRGSIPSLHSAPAGEVKQRRRRRRSKSPGNTKRPPEELRQHFEYDLVDTDGMSTEQLRDIPYVKVETKANAYRVKYSPKFRQKIWASRRKSFGDADKHARPGESLSRQDSYNTEPAGGYAQSARLSGRHSEGRLAGTPDSHMPEQGSHSPGVGQNGVYNTSMSRAYHNPMYLNHSDARQGTNSGGDTSNRVVNHNQFDHVQYSHLKQRHQSGYKGDSEYAYDRQKETNRLSSPEFNKQSPYSSSFGQGQQNRNPYGHESARRSQGRLTSGQQYPNSEVTTSHYNRISNSLYQHSYNDTSAARSVIGMEPHHNSNPAYNGGPQGPVSHTPPSYSDVMGGNVNRGVSTPPRGTLRYDLDHRSTPPRSSDQRSTPPRSSDHKSTPPRPANYRTTPPRSNMQHFDDQRSAQVPHSGRSGSGRGYGGSQNRHSGHFNSTPSPNHHQMRNSYTPYQSQYADRHTDQGPQFMGSPPMHNPGKSPHSYGVHSAINSESPRPGYHRPQHPSTYRSDLVTQI